MRMSPLIGLFAANATFTLSEPDIDWWGQAVGFIPHKTQVLVFNPRAKHRNTGVAAIRRRARKRRNVMRAKRRG